VLPASAAPPGLKQNPYAIPPASQTRPGLEIRRPSRPEKPWPQTRLLHAARPRAAGPANSVNSNPSIAPFTAWTAKRAAAWQSSESGRSREGRPTARSVVFPDRPPNPLSSSVEVCAAI
jgi:hypothetical protein